MFSRFFSAAVVAFAAGSCAVRGFGGVKSARAANSEMANKEWI
jgi:hypothetical protein